MQDTESSIYFPSQKLSSSKKNDKWIRDCIDGTINIAYTYGVTRRSPMANKLRNYNLFNNKIDDLDFEEVLNPLNLKGDQVNHFKLPASIKPYDIISQYFNLLLGEESKRLFQPLVIAVNDDALTLKEKERKQEIIAALEETLINQDPEFLQEILEKYEDYTPKMLIESTATKILNHFYRAENLDTLFNNVFKDVLLAGEEIAKVDCIAKRPRVRRVNPMETWYHLNSNSDLIDDAEKIYERNMMSVSEIVDEFYEYLTPEQIDELEDYGQSASGMYALGGIPLAIPEVNSIYSFENTALQRGIPVHRCTWKGKKKMYIWRFPDENGDIQETLVEEDFKAPEGTELQAFWINEYYSGVRIGTTIYPKKLAGPNKQQFRRLDNLSECKSGYIGTVYSATNTQSVSLMDRLVPWIYQYLVIWYRVELAIAKNIGKIAFIDLSLVPDGWQIEKWLYYASSMGFGFVNSFNESMRKTTNQQNQSTQNKGLDLETGQYIQQHIALLEFIETKIQGTTGITPQRLGEISASELVGNTERATVQSSHITEPYFFPHEFFKKRVCEALIEVAKEAFKDGAKIRQYITDDLSTVLFEINEDFINADYSVFLSNSTKEQQNLQMYKQLLQAAIQNEKIAFSTVVKTLNSMSTSDIQATLLKGEKQAQKAAQEGMQAEEQAKQQTVQMTQDWEREKMAFEAEQNQLDRENDIQIAELKAIGSDAMSTDTNDIGAIQEISKAAIEQSKLEHQRIIDAKKLELEKEKIQAENKRTEMEKEHFNKSQKHEKEMKNKEMIHKERLEHIKARAKRAQANKKNN